MVGHALWFDKCFSHFHEDDGRYPTIQIIYDWPDPTTLTELRSFLGLANFYQRFVLGFSHIAWALSQINMGGGKEKFAWGQSQQQAVNDLT